MNCFSNKQNGNFNPPEVEELRTYKEFNKMSQDDIMAFHMRYRSITKGQPFINRNQFLEMLHSFNIYPNRTVTNRMFDIIDKDSSFQIDFIEFMRFIVLILDGTPENKSNFIFKMIAFREKEVFTFNDLVDFYRIVNIEDDLRSSTIPEADKETDNQSEEIAQVVFEMMRKRIISTVDIYEFQAFIKNEKSAVEFFNFFNTDLETTTKGIRIKNNFVHMIQTLNRMKIDLENLEKILFPKLNQGMISFSNINKQSRIGQPFYSILKEKMKQKHPLRSKLINTSKKYFKTNGELITEENISENIFSRENMDINERDELKFQRPANEEQRTNLKGQELKTSIKTSDQEIRYLLMAMNSKIDSLINELEKEIDSINKDEQFSYNLKNNFKSKKNNYDNKKQVFLNNPNWNIVTTMISGIQKSLNIISRDKCHLLRKSHFKFHNKIEIEAVYSNKFDKCKFKDYAPNVFQSIRRQFGIGYESYTKSLGVDTFKNAFFDKLYLMLSETSSGKSGSFFFHTCDSKYMIKTIKKDEFEVLRRILPRYHEHIMKNPNTLLARYFGLHQMKCYAGSNMVYDIYIVVMNNIFDIENPELILHKYDLKGSTYKRITPIDEVEQGAAKKDLNFIQDGVKINVSYGTRSKLIEQIKSDSDFLAKHNIIDYSMLVGVIHTNNDDIDSKPLFRSNFFDLENEGKKDRESKRITFLESFDQRWNYYIGIIDTLTNYNFKKKSEFVAKRILVGKGASCIPPDDYRDRFVSFMKKSIETNL